MVEALICYRVSYKFDPINDNDDSGALGDLLEILKGE